MLVLCLCLRIVLRISLLTALRTRLVLGNSCFNLPIHFGPKRGHQLVDVIGRKKFIFFLWGVGWGGRGSTWFPPWGVLNGLLSITGVWLWWSFCISTGMNLGNCLPLLHCSMDNIIVLLRCTRQEIPVVIQQKGARYENTEPVAKLQNYYLSSKTFGR